MSAIIKLIELASGEPSTLEGMYLVDYEPHAKVMVASPHKERAKLFRDVTTAMTEWKRGIGFRPDGKPDRPLTAWTIEVETL